MSYKGVDISNNNGYLDIGKLKSSGYNFIIAKATEGTGFVDKYYQTFAQQSKILKIPIGAYHFARFKNDASAKVEADFFLTVAMQEKPDFLALDLEDEEAEGNLTSAVNIFMNTINSEGIPIILYSSPAYIKEHLDTTVQKYFLWIANYGVKNPDIYCWNEYSIWQYTDEENGLDANIMSDKFYDLLTKKEEVIDMGTIIVYSNEVDQRYAESLADAMNSPTINANRPFDYSKYSKVICIGGAPKDKPWTSYATMIISGSNRQSTEQMVLDYIKSGCK